MDYKRETFIGEPYGNFDYLLVPKSEYTYELVREVHNLPFLFSEWQSFYGVRFAAVNGFSRMELENREIEFVKLPIITDEECFRFGL